MCYLTWLKLKLVARPRIVALQVADLSWIRRGQGQNEAGTVGKGTLSSISAEYARNNLRKAVYLISASRSRAEARKIRTSTLHETPGFSLSATHRRPQQHSEAVLALWAAGPRIPGCWRITSRMLGQGRSTCSPALLLDRILRMGSSPSLRQPKSRTPCCLGILHLESIGKTSWRRSYRPRREDKGGSADIVAELVSVSVGTHAIKQERLGPGLFLGACSSGP